MLYRRILYKKITRQF